MKAILITVLLSILSLHFHLGESFTSPTVLSCFPQYSIVSSSTLLKGRTNENIEPVSTYFNRRQVLQSVSALPLFITQTAYAKTIKPNEAFQNLITARNELKEAKYLIASQDIEGLKEYLSDTSLKINNYEENAGALLASKNLDAESKKAIGTIRTYGSGADVIIMYGGLKGELDEENPNMNNLFKNAERAWESSNEVIAICKSHGFTE